MKIGFTGTQNGMTELQKVFVRRCLQAMPVTEVHHGDCIGADADFHAIAKDELGLHTIGHPPIRATKRAFCSVDESREPKPYLDRNKDIVAECGCLIATPGEKEEVLRSGTWATIRAARRSHTRYHIIYPGNET